MRKQSKIIEILKNNNAILVRNKKHEIWKLPNGKIFTLSTTSSDRNVEKVQLRLLNKLLT